MFAKSAYMLSAPRLASKGFPAKRIDSRARTSPRSRTAKLPDRRGGRRVVEHELLQEQDLRVEREVDVALRQREVVVVGVDDFDVPDRRVVRLQRADQL